MLAWRSGVGLKGVTRGSWSLETTGRLRYGEVQRGV